MTTLARHDLLILPPEAFGLRWSGRFAGQATEFDAASVAKARGWRAELLRLNPHAIVLADLLYGEVPVDRLPMSSALWLRAPNGHIVTSITTEGTRGQIRIERPAFQVLFQQQVAALMATGVVDGVALRDWKDDGPVRLALIQAVRRGVGRTGLIVIGSGLVPPVHAGPYVNGLLIVDDPKGKPAWSQFSGLSDWARAHTKRPGFTVLESIASRNRLQLYDMRMATATALVFGDGYVTFEDSAGHDWYELWAPTLGPPIGKAYRKDGAYRREFAKGLAVFNPPTNQTVYLEFPSLQTSEAKSVSTRRVSVQPGDGDIILAKPPEH